MSAQADALMGIFGYKRVGNDDSQGSAEGATSGIRESDATGEAGEVDADLRRQPNRNNRAKGNTGTRSVGIKPARLKKCAQCRCEFQPQRMGQKVCSPSCAQSIAKKKREKVERATDRQKREQLKGLREWKADLKKVMHLYVRLRDEGKPCISCDTVLIRTGKPGGDYDAGHCRSVGSAKHLEFDDLNVHGQCKHCNNTRGLAGNYHEYRNRLPARIGQAAFDALMCDQEARHMTISDCKERIAHYKTLIKELQNG